MSETGDQVESSERLRYEYIAHQINREDGLINNRLTWTLQANGFLFAALALVGKEFTGPIRQVFDVALPVTGLAVSVAGILGAYAAQEQIRYLTTMWYERPMLFWPRPFGGKGAFLLGTAPAYIPMAVFAMVWVAVFVWPLIQGSSPGPIVQSTTLPASAPPVPDSSSGPSVLLRLNPATRPAP